MRKFLIATLAVAGFATSVLADVKSCDTMWVECIRTTSVQNHGELAHDLNLACERMVMQCRNTGELGP